jgi:hypothetical protein
VASAIVLCERGVFFALQAAKDIAKWQTAHERAKVEAATPFAASSGGESDEATHAHKRYRSAGRGASFVAAGAPLSSVNATPIGAGTATTAQAAEESASESDDDAKAHESTPAAAAAVLVTLATGAVACTLCKRQFASLELADKHVALSPLHAQNVAAAAAAAAEAAALEATKTAARAAQRAADRKVIKQQRREARDEMLATERRLVSGCSSCEFRDCRCLRRQSVSNSVNKRCTRNESGVRRRSPRAVQPPPPRSPRPMSSTSTSARASPTTTSATACSRRWAGRRALDWARAARASSRPCVLSAARAVPVSALVRRAD